MSNYKTVIAAIDINAEHDSVIKKALSVCQSPDCIKLTYIALPTVYLQPYLYGAEYGVLDDTDRIESARKKLESIAKRYKIKIKNTYLKSGYAADEIKQFANEIHADLIVIGTHGRSGIKLLLGSTANSVLHGANQDVLAVRVHEPE